MHIYLHLLSDHVKRQHRHDNRRHLRHDNRRPLSRLSGSSCQGDLGGLCVALRSISSRTEQLEVKVTTKSKAPVLDTVGMQGTGPCG